MPALRLIIGFGLVFFDWRKARTKISTKTNYCLRNLTAIRNCSFIHQSESDVHQKIQSKIDLILKLTSSFFLSCDFAVFSRSRCYFLSTFLYEPARTELFSKEAQQTKIATFVSFRLPGTKQNHSLYNPHTTHTTGIHNDHAFRTLQEYGPRWLINSETCASTKVLFHI